jgi:hypothetical protein
MIKGMKLNKSGQNNTVSEPQMYKQYEEGIYEYIETSTTRVQLCPLCKEIMSDMPGTRDAVCKNCGYKDPCCE